MLASEYYRSVEAETKGQRASPIQPFVPAIYTGPSALNTQKLFAPEGNAEHAGSDMCSHHGR